MPVWLDDFFWTYQNVVYALGINGLLALSMYVVLAVGQLSLGQAAFMGLGAYSSALMTLKLHWPFFVVLPASCVVPAIFALTTGDRSVGTLTEESVLVAVVLIIGYVMSLIFQFTHPDATLGGHGLPSGHAGPAWSGRVAIVVLIGAAALLTRQV